MIIQPILARRLICIIKVQQINSFTLLIRKDPDGMIKYSLCHAPKYVRSRMLAYRQCKRYFIEQALREPKMELGLNEYQTRSEKGWLRHMAFDYQQGIF